eukprot:tig00021521_g22058.t1
MRARASLLTGRDVRAEALVDRARRASLETARGGLWTKETVRMLDAVLSWRAGDVPAAAAAVEATLAFWRTQVATAIWNCMPAMLIALDFALWWRWDSRRRLAALEPGRPAAAAARPDRDREPLLRRLLCLGPRRPRRPASAVFPAPVGRRPSLAANSSTSSSFFFFAGPRRSSLATTSSTRPPSSSAVHVHPAASADGDTDGADAAPVPMPAPVATPVTAEAAAAEAARAAALARTALARALDPDAPAPRRLSLLRTARDAFVRGGLQPWVALSSLWLARCEPEPDDAAEAAAAARRVARETGLRLPPAKTGAKRGTDEYISLWV